MLQSFPQEWRACQIGVLPQQVECVPPGLLEDLRILENPCTLEFRQPALTRPPQPARAAQPEVRLGDSEAVGRRDERVDPLVPRAEEDAERLARPAPAPDR